MFDNYGGKTGGKVSALMRREKHRGDEDSGAPRIQAFFDEEELLGRYGVKIYGRLIANGDDELESDELEITLGQFTGVGGIIGLNQALMGPWRYPSYGQGSNTAHRFCMTVSALGGGADTIRAAQNSVLHKRTARAAR